LIQIIFTLPPTHPIPTSVQKSSYIQNQRLTTSPIDTNLVYLSLATKGNINHLPRTLQGCVGGVLASVLLITFNFGLSFLDVQDVVHDRNLNNFSFCCQSDEMG
jgi:hypothetical protein